MKSLRYQTLHIQESGSKLGKTLPFCHLVSRPQAQLKCAGDQPLGTVRTGAFLGRCNWEWPHHRKDCDPVTPLTKRTESCPPTYCLRSLSQECQPPAYSDPRTRQTQGKVLSKVAMSTNSLTRDVYVTTILQIEKQSQTEKPSSRNQTFGGADSCLEHTHSSPEGICQSNQTELFRVRCCPHKSTGPSLPRCPF